MNFLVIKSGSDFTKYEKSIISRSQIIHQEKDIEILSLTKDALLNFDNAEIIEIISEYNKNIVLNGFHNEHIFYIIMTLINKNLKLYLKAQVPLNH